MQHAVYNMKPFDILFHKHGYAAVCILSTATAHICTFIIGAVSSKTENEGNRVLY